MYEDNHVCAGFSDINNGGRRHTQIPRLLLRWTRVAARADNDHRLGFGPWGWMPVLGDINTLNTPHMEASHGWANACALNSVPADTSNAVVPESYLASGAPTIRGSFTPGSLRLSSFGGTLETTPHLVDPAGVGVRRRVRRRLGASCGSSVVQSDRTELAQLTRNAFSQTCLPLRLCWGVPFLASKRGSQDCVHRRCDAHGFVACRRPRHAHVGSRQLKVAKHSHPAPSSS